MNWLAANATSLLVLATVAWLGFALVRAVVASRRARERPDTGEAFARTERVRRQIRRKVAERKASGGAPPATPIAGEAKHPESRVRPIDPFGGPRRSWWRRLGRWLGGP